MHRRLTALIVLVALLATAASLAAPVHAALPATVAASTQPMEAGIAAEIAPAAQPLGRRLAHAGRGTEDPLAKNDITFVQDTGGFYDQYRNRTALPGGIMTFDITIDRYFSPLMANVDANGFLLNPQELIDKHILPDTVTLSMFPVC